MAVNARSVFLTNRRATQIMMVQDRDAAGLRGSIVNVGSVLAESPSPEFFGTIGYAASKGAIRSLTLSAAAKYAEQSVRFNLIEPGLIDTPMADWIRLDPPALSVFEESLPAGRMGTPDEIAGVVSFLASPDASYMHGAVVVADGGVTA